MAFRAVRTAAIGSLLPLILVLTAGCGGTGEMRDAGTDTVTVIPDDTAQLSAEQLARLPLYGGQTLPCSAVRGYLDSVGDTAATDSVTIGLEEGRLVARPSVAMFARGDTVRWRADSPLLWVVRFTGPSPLRQGRLEARGRGSGRSLITTDSARCGHFVYHVAAYHTERDSVYVADPIFWVY